MAALSYSLRSTSLPTGYSRIAASPLRAAPVRAPTLRRSCRRTAVTSGVAVQAAASRPWTSNAPPGAATRLDLELDTADFQRSVTLTALRRKKGGTAILVQEVAPGSGAAAAGLRAGMQLLALSDPIRQSEMWELNGLASLKYTRQAIEGRALNSITVRVTADVLPEWRQATDAARAALGSDSEGEELSAEERAELLVQLDRMHESATARRAAAREEKLDTRRALELENQERKRSSTPFFAAFVALFILVPVGVVLAALGTGYIDTLGPR